MALKLVHNPVSSGRAAALRGVLDSSEVIAKEAVQVLNGYGNHLNELIESVEHVADRAQALTVTQKRIDVALQQASTFLGQLEVPRMTEQKIKQGPKAGLTSFLAALEQLLVCMETLSKYRGLQAADSMYNFAVSLKHEAVLLAFDDYQGLLKRYARVPDWHKPVPPEDTLTPEFLTNYQELMPLDAVDRILKLYGALQRCGENMCVKTYCEVRSSLMERMQLQMNNIQTFEDASKLAWPHLESRLHVWAKYATRISLHIVQEQNLARQVFGELVGEEIFMEVVTSATNPSIGDAKALISFKRIPEKVFVILDIAEKLASEVPAILACLPARLLAIREELMSDFAIEARGTFASFCTSLGQDLQRYSVGNGSVHHLSAQTVTFLKRLLSHKTAASAVLSNDEPSGTDWLPKQLQTSTPAQRTVIQKSVEMVLDLVRTSLVTISRSCKSKALAALFLMNNAHYQLKAVQSNNMMNLISREWQDDCEAKAETYASQYQKHSWGPLLAIMSESPNHDQKMSWTKEKAFIKDRWHHLNMALDSLIEQESGWLVPDQALRATLQDTILEDFVKVYQDFWRQFETLPFSRNPEKYLRIKPDALIQIVRTQLLQFQGLGDSTMPERSVQAESS